MLDTTQIQSPRKRKLGQVVAVASLLACETVILQLEHRETSDPLCCDSSNGTLQTFVCGGGGGQGNLLLKHDANQRGKPRPAAPHRRWPKPPDNRGEIIIAPAEFADRTKQGVPRELRSPL
jgi:hypothetical protein